MGKDIQKMLNEREAKQNIREQQQGLGKPILAGDLKDQKIIVVGNIIHYSKDWKTFTDFLLYYIKHALMEAAYVR